MALLPWLLVACALQAPQAEQVLADGGADDRASAEALEAFRAAPDDLDAALRAARVLFAAADLSVQRALVAAIEAQPQPGLEQVLAVEEQLPEAARERVLSLSGAGAEAAQVIVDARPDDVEANVLLAQHLSFVAWANGPMRSLMAGYGGRIEAAMKRALAVDASWDHGAPLRLRGRFLAEAPWPLRDREQSLELLQRAVATRAMPIHHLFLGDLLFDRGDRDGALAQWRQAVTAEPDETTAAVAPWHRRLAELRVEAALR